MNLERFLRAQNNECSGYKDALEEIQCGEKTSHWIWYIFPQLRGLGKSMASDYYGISGIREARAYLKNPILENRLVEISTAAYSLETNDPVKVFGITDSKKFRSCMTLFMVASNGEIKIFEKCIQKYFGGVPDEKTLLLLSKRMFLSKRTRDT